MVNMEHEVSDHIKNAMGTAGRSHRWTAEAAGIAYATFHRKLGNGGWLVSEIARIAKALNVSPASLLPVAFVAETRRAA